MIYFYKGNCPKCGNTDTVKIEIADEKSYLIYKCSKCGTNVKALIHCVIRSTVIKNKLFGIQLGLYDTLKQLGKAQQQDRAEYLANREKRKEESKNPESLLYKIKKYFNRGNNGKKKT
jgi:predicted nucleic-acid-binding Zn-ribbon protein